MSDRKMTSVAEELDLLYLEQCEEARIAEEEAEEEFWGMCQYEDDAELIEELEHYLDEMWDRADPKEWDIYSDVFKDIHGFRPHFEWAYAHFFGAEN